MSDPAGAQQHISAAQYTGNWGVHALSRALLDRLGFEVLSDAASGFSA